MSPPPPLVRLLLPGHGGADPSHPFARWAAAEAPAVQLLAQHDWQRPLRGDWLMQLENAWLDVSGPVQVVAHDLGCWLLAAWAQVSRQPMQRMRPALLINPLPCHAPAWQSRLPSWQCTTPQRLPFAAQVLSHGADAAQTAYAAQLAQAWGASHRIAPSEASGHAPWPTAPQLQALCAALLKDNHGH